MGSAFCTVCVRYVSVCSAVRYVVPYGVPYAVPYSVPYILLPPPPLYPSHPHPHASVYPLYMLILTPPPYSPPPPPPPYSSLSTLIYITQGGGIEGEGGWEGHANIIPGGGRERGVLPNIRNSSGTPYGTPYPTPYGTVFASFIPPYPVQHSYRRGTLIPNLPEPHGEQYTREVRDGPFRPRRAATTRPTPHRIPP